MLIRQLEIAAGPYADADWLDPTVVPPDNARRFKSTDSELRFALRGRAGPSPDADVVSLGVMTVDAYVLVEIPGGGTVRGKSVLEVEGSALPGQVLLASSLFPGFVGRLHLTLTDVSAAVVEVLLVSGGRVL